MIMGNLGTGAVIPVVATELFPELTGEIDRRVAASEQRIKYWVLFGVLTNLLAILGLLIPAVFYLGQLSRDASAALVTIQEQKAAAGKDDDWRRRREIWESTAEQWMTGQGFQPPRRSSGD